MISVHIISIAQSVNLSSGQMDNILVLQLPDGTQCNAVVPEAVVDRVFQMAGGTPQPSASGEPAKFRPGPASWEEQPPPPPEPSPLEVPPAPSTVDPDGPPPEFNWAELSDVDLPQHLKAALTYLHVPPVLTATALRNLIGQINERFGEEEWAEVMDQSKAAAQPAPPQPAPTPPLRTQGLQRPQRAPSPPVGKVQWSDGSPMLPGQQNKGRTVPANSAGWPIVNDGSVDPGELVGGGDDSDEDGVGQF